MADQSIEILDLTGINRALIRIAHEILEHNRGTENLVLIGIRTGGDYLAAELQKKIAEIEGVMVPLGTVDITMYRDDLGSRSNLRSVKPTSASRLGRSRWCWSMMFCLPDAQSALRWTHWSTWDGLEISSWPS